MVKSGHQASWQYISEDTPENVTSAGVPFRLPGKITGNTTIEPRFTVKEMRGLHQPSDTDMRGVDSVQPSKNEYVWSISYVPMKRINTPKYDFRHFVGYAYNASSSTANTGGQTYGTNLATNTRTFTIQKQIDNLYQQLNGCMIGKLQVKCSIDSPVDIMADGFGSAATNNVDLGKTAATSLVNATPFMWQDVQIYVDGSLATNCTAFEFTLNNNNENAYVLGDRDPRNVLNKIRSIDLSITKFYTDVGQYLAAKNATVKSVTIALTDAASTVQFGFRGCKYEGHPIPAPIEGILEHTLKLKCASAFLI